ncbi:MAG: FAD-dependent oxidoreductase [Zetaproteobacteria bacterium]|nr:FAD-dependent oxidoreductase [Zetaproteobacteria bacterium]
MPQLMILGAGVAGTACAHTLSNAGITLEVVEKSRGTGGRTAGKRFEGGVFDQGARYFTIKDPTFAKYIQAQMAQGTVKPWHISFGSYHPNQGWQALQDQPTRYVACPQMNNLAKSLLGNITTHYQHKIIRAVYNSSSWHLYSDHGQVWQAKQVVCTLPYTQTKELFGSYLSNPTELSKAGVNTPTWVVAFTTSHQLSLPFHAGFIHSSILNWFAYENSKPQRSNQQHTYVLHASAAYSQANVDTPAAEVKKTLIDAFATLTEQTIHPTQDFTHRWLYADLIEGQSLGELYYPEVGLGLCGDWLLGGRVEGAYLSGVQLAQKILRDYTSSSLIHNEESTHGNS